MTKRALIIQGGWEGHQPRECAAFIAAKLHEYGIEAETRDSLGVLADRDAMRAFQLIVPMWTMGSLTGEQEAGLLDAVRAGAGLAGFHGGMGDAFRSNTSYQYCVGGQFVAHPGGCQPMHAYNIVDRRHAITAGMDDFALRDTEQYYMHVDPSNHVLVTTTFANGVVMPAAWTRMWGEGRVFYASWGHQLKDLDSSAHGQAILLRGMRWACA